ncbi:MAG: GspE/PulE family protein [Clostridium sp.]|uniref:GspE/PulE family protein n=1 Tax=Clostridium sp. TaxID=1506 RepID=UPI002FC77A01
MFSVKQEFNNKRVEGTDKVVICNSLEGLRVDSKVTSLIPRDICLKYNLIPLEANHQLKTVNILTSYPIMGLNSEDIRFILGYEPIFLHYHNLQELEQFICNALQSTLIIKDTRDEIKSVDAPKDQEGDAPAVKIVNYIINEALRLLASDIHIEPFKSYYRVRFRVDGYLREGFRFSKASYNAIISRIKVISKIDISEKRLPLDGRIGINSNGTLWDLRVSTIPTVNGEKIVIRIFQEKTKIKGLHDIGLINENLSIIESFLNQKSGIILVSGPTGSGKSTTLYTMLRQLDMNKRNIITIEDPVEQCIEGITQVNVNSKIGFDFASGLRSILRQDPDVIMVGEIRDSHTASIAMRAAITGHLVLSTIHTHDSHSVVERLLDMGIEPYLISSGLSGVISQRLVRKICNNCVESYTPSDYEINILNITRSDLLKKGSGCIKCSYTGYLGRIGVFETLQISSSYRESLGNRLGSSNLIKEANEENFISLKDSAISLLKMGVTTTSEVLSII